MMPTCAFSFLSHFNSATFFSLTPIPFSFHKFQSFFVMASGEHKPRTVEEIFEDFQARRTALVRALTQDVDEFYRQCDPDADNLCLIGHPNEMWQVTTPSPEVPPETPEPAIGINFARNGMARKDWLYFVAVHSDSWLLSVAFYPGALLNPSEREKLFKLINGLPTVSEAVTCSEATKDKLTMDSGSKSGGSTEVNVLAASRSSDEQVKSNTKKVKNSIICELCDGIYSPGEFWMTCTVCEMWFHGVCVKMTPEEAMGTSYYKCPSCTFILDGEDVR